MKLLNGDSNSNKQGLGS